MNYTPDDVIRVRGLLIEIATRGEMISYSDLAKRAGLQWNNRNTLDRKHLGELLGEVSRQEYGRGRPLLTAVVVYKGGGLPGPGFWGFEGFPATQEFIETEQRRVHDYWKWR